MMKRYITMTVTFILMMFATVPAIVASEKENQHGPDEKKKSKWEQFMDDKKFFLIKEVGLTPEEQEKFFPVYEEMCKKKLEIQKEARDKRNVVRKSKEKISDKQYMEAALAQSNATIEEAKLEKSYIEHKFSKILSAEQIYKLVFAEQKFPREMMRRSLEDKYRPKPDDKPRHKK